MIGLEQMTPAGQENTEPVVMPDDEVLYELADLFRVFGDSTRIKILYALHDNELCVQDIANAVQLSQSAVSHQLRVLKDTKLVRFRRDGKTVYYALDGGLIHDGEHPLGHGLGGGQHTGAQTGGRDDSLRNFFHGSELLHHIISG